MKDQLLGTSELMMLLAILQRGNDAYGLQVQDELRATIGREVSLGAIYTTLDRLEDKKLVKSKLADQQSDRLGRPRRYFRVTNAGITACKSSQDALRKLAHGLPSLRPEGAHK
jgi:PadR family transcriptional regulator PadR